ncbi:MAG TPA: gamma-glutamylcyclotransferase family protein [Streptomyces sp.]|uniref:gamma-glutamylcyclotransferase family protein n=1 Tax=Streptomyces sp. TaxID=1931 RepID=UPI002D6C5AF4|nr:gamma-glutamylcyclotransferase family protein [Streptomyces sp.]HZG05951.1 gamma-glutamylcyclotransferase family protein [Streptomyces sp.]
MLRRPADQAPTPVDAGHRDPLAAAPDPLFAYGTLRFPEVLRALLGRVPARTPAGVAGWRAAALEGRPYPGLVPAGGTATGLLLTDLTPGEWRVLDAFEGEEYERRRLSLTDGRHCWAYVWTGGGVLPGDWSAGDFAERHLAAYAARCAPPAAGRHGPAGLPAGSETG